MSAVSSSRRWRASLESAESSSRIPPPSYRHAAPSGPWPWMDFDSVPESDTLQSTPKCTHGKDCNKCWTQYPQSLFPNWTPSQVRKCGMKDKIAGSHTCVLYHVDVHKDGHFFNAGSYSAPQSQSDELWSRIVARDPEDLRLRVLCLENMTVPVMQMLGTRYNIEPYFFSSSLNWIPSHYQENPNSTQGDHLTITLTFIRPMNAQAITPSDSNPYTQMPSTKSTHIIDTQLPLIIRSEDGEHDDLVLALDLLAVHMVRTPGNSTIITYHPSYDLHDLRVPHTSAKHLHSRIVLAGESIYWQNIFKKTEDPTLVLLTILWYALYSWDEALEILWEHIGRLESSVIESSDISFTRQLHEIHAHILHYSSLLNDFRKSVDFVLKMPNPAMDAPIYNNTETFRIYLQKECENLLIEIDRLSMSRDMQDKRLKNLMDLVFSSVNIEDSRRMQPMAEGAVRDSHAMKQISYLTMVFLPASLCANAFSMNIREIVPNTAGTLWQYLTATASITAITIWVIIAFQGNWHVEGTGLQMSLWLRLLWPFIAIKRTYTKMKGRIIRTSFKNAKEKRAAVMDRISMG